MDDPHDLSRFVRAQESVYDAALSELAGGRKRTHWMWFIFPQIDGLGSSPTTRRFAIKGVAEARAYLAHPVLGPRLLQCAEAVLAIEGRSAAEIFGSPDDLKLRSSATLFAHVLLPGSVFDRLIAKYFAGVRDEKTLLLLDARREPSLHFEGIDAAAPADVAGRPHIASQQSDRQVMQAINTGVVQMTEAARDGDALAHDVRVHVFREAAATARVPQAPDISRALGRSEADVRAALHQLALAKVLILAPNDGNIWAANPFCAVPSGFRVAAAGRQYWGICIWDALGIAAALGSDAVISAPCGDCGTGMTLEVRNGRLIRTEGVVHFAIPAHHWWDNIGFT